MCSTTVPQYKVLTVGSGRLVHQASQQQTTVRHTEQSHEKAGRDGGTHMQSGVMSADVSALHPRVVHAPIMCIWRRIPARLDAPASEVTLTLSCIEGEECLFAIVVS